jgi:hypothetical protein
MSEEGEKKSNRLYHISLNRKKAKRVIRKKGQKINQICGKKYVWVTP